MENNENVTPKPQVNSAQRLDAFGQGRSVCGPAGLPAGPNQSSEPFGAGIQGGGPAGAPTDTAGSASQSCLDSALKNFVSLDAPIPFPKWEDVK